VIEKAHRKMHAILGGVKESPLGEAVLLGKNTAQRVRPKTERIWDNIKKVKKAYGG